MIALTSQLRCAHSVRVDSLHAKSNASFFLFLISDGFFFYSFDVHLKLAWASYQEKTMPVGGEEGLYCE